MANVLSLVPYKIFPAKTGGQKGIALFNQYFSELQLHRLICVTIKSNDPQFASYPLLNVLSDARWRYINVFTFYTLRRIIKKYQVTTVIIEHPYFGWLGILLQRLCNVRLIVHSHNIESDRFRSVGKWWWRILRAYEKYVHRHADHNFCISEEDRQFMIRRFNVSAANCTVVTYGIEWNHPPAATDKQQAKVSLQEIYGLTANTIFYLFNGTLDYPPNADAVKAIVHNINPLLLKTTLDYKIFICGKNLPPELNELKEYKNLNIIYTGFVEDISVYFKGVDVFINPVNDGGGIKTKLVEALGYNLAAVSTHNGATGVDERLCNGKLLLVKDNDWTRFCDEMIKAPLLLASITGEYFEHFYWKNIAKKAASIVE